MEKIDLIWKKFWQNKSLRFRLNFVYITLLFILLFSIFFTLQNLIRKDLTHYIDLELLQTKKQFDIFLNNIQFSKQKNNELDKLKLQFSSSVVQVEPLLTFRAKNIQTEWRKAQDINLENDFINILKKQSSIIRPQSINLKKDEYIKMTEYEWTELLNKEQIIIVRKNIKNKNYQHSRILVSLQNKTLIVDGESILMPVIVYIGKSMKSINTTTARFGLIIFALLLVGWFFTSLATYLLSKRVLSPLNKLKQAVENINSDNLEERIDISESDEEAKVLALAFNKMLDRIEDSFNIQKRFNSDSSHELRTPITIILGSADYLLKRGNLGEKERKRIEVIHRNSKSMNKLVEDLLQSSIDKGNIKINYESINLSKWLKEIEKDMFIILKEKNIKLHYKNTIKIGYFDSQNMRRVIENLINNSIKAQSKNIAIKINKKKNFLVFIVKDDGIGIELKDKTQLFRPFYRLDYDRGRQTGGTGLGLSIIKNIVEAHKGQIEIFSAGKNKGTTVVIKLNQKNIDIRF